MKDFSTILPQAVPQAPCQNAFRQLSLSYDMGYYVLPQPSLHILPLPAPAKRGSPRLPLNLRALFFSSPMASRR